MMRFNTYKVNLILGGVSDIVRSKADLAVKLDGSTKEDIKIFEIVGNDIHACVTKRSHLIGLEPTFIKDFDNYLK